MATKQLIEHRARLRYRIVEWLYDQSGGDRRWTATFEEIGRAIGEKPDEVETAIVVLREQGNVEIHTMGGHTSLTSGGIREYEESLESPGEGTENFPPYLIQQTQNFYGVVGAVQGAHSQPSRHLPDVPRVV